MGSFLDLGSRLGKAPLVNGVHPDAARKKTALNPCLETWVRQNRCLSLLFADFSIGSCARRILKDVLVR